MAYLMKEEQGNGFLVISNNLSVKGSSRTLARCNLGSIPTTALNFYNMRQDRVMSVVRRKGYPNRMNRAKELGATHFLNVSDHRAHERYPVYVYAGQDLRTLKQQFKSVNFTITEVQ